MVSLFRTRLRYSELFAAGKLSRWPYCEGYIATQVKIDGFRIQNLSAIVNTDSYDWWPPYHEKELVLSSENAIIHPVLSGTRFVNSLLRYDFMPILSWFDRGSTLRTKLSYESDEIVLPAMLKKLFSKKLFRAAIYLVNIVDRNKMSSVVNLLVGDRQSELECINSILPRTASAWQSSHSQWSRGASREEDAIGALSGPPSGRYSFHTALEINPWWMCDLGDLFLTAQFIIHNRLDAERARAKTLALHVSLDAKAWTPIVFPDNDLQYQIKNNLPIEMSLQEKMVVRYIRIESEGIQFLHLDKLFIRGYRIPEDGSDWRVSDGQVDDVFQNETIVRHAVT